VDTPRPSPRTNRTRRVSRPGCARGLLGLCGAPACHSGRRSDDAGRGRGKLSPARGAGCWIWHKELALRGARADGSLRWGAGRSETVGRVSVQGGNSSGNAERAARGRGDCRSKATPFSTFIYTDAHLTLQKSSFTVALPPTHPARTRRRAKSCRSAFGFQPWSLPTSCQPHAAKQQAPPPCVMSAQRRAPSAQRRAPAPPCA
jgi:hypothetical protein